MREGYQSLCLRKRCFRWQSDNSRIMQLSYVFVMHSLLEITRRYISLCDKDVLNDMVTLETITKGNKEKRFEKCT